MTEPDLGRPGDRFGEVVVVIPSLHPDPDFPGFVAGLAGAGFAEVLVIDDGSGPDYAHHFATIAAISGVRLLTHEVNRGKGAALKTAFADLLPRRPEAIVVTADSDGQHTAEGIEAVAAAVQAAGSEQVMVLGTRALTERHVPFLSRLGNTVTTLVVRLLYGQRVPDTQTGLRGTPGAFLAPMLAVPGERFDYEMNVLTWALTSGVPIRQVPVATIYHDASNSQSHFRPVRDSLIIYRSIFRRAGSYVASSGIGAIVDLAAFTMLIDGIFHGRSHLAAVATATIGARVLSSAVNFTINRRVVFAQPGSALRYFALATGILAASTLGTTALAALFAGHVVWAKLVIDVALFAIGYHVQRTWVFRRPG